jgi:hypothetical protein
LDLNSLKSFIRKICLKVLSSSISNFIILNRELKPDYYVCGEHSDRKPKFLPTGTKSWNITEYKYIDPENGKIIEKPKKELDKEN